MATLTDLIDEIVDCWDASDEEIDSVTSFIRTNGLGVYSLCSDARGDIEIVRESQSTLAKFKADFATEWDEDYYEQSVDDYFADFNTGDEARDGFLFSEEFFTIEINAL